MKLTKANVCLGVLIAASAVVVGVRGHAQSVKAQSITAQQNRALPRVTDTVDDTNRVVMHGNVHPLARAEFDQGAVPDSQQVTRALVILQRSPEQEAALRQLLDDQQNRNSPNFHAWLTPEQFGAQFGPADADIQAVSSWLTSHGFQNLKVASGRTAIEFSGNAGQVRNAFQAEIHRYMIKGKQQVANASDPQVPAALAPVVAGIVGLHNFQPHAQFHRLGTFRRDNNTGQLSPLFTFTPSGSGPLNGVGPADFAKIYNLPAAFTGSGQSIVVVEDSNINVSDVTLYRGLFGLPASTPQIILDGPDPGLNGDEGEADLDVQLAGGVAPGAQIIMVVAEQPQTGAGAAGVDLAVLFAIDNNLAPVISESFGSCESAMGAAGNAFENALFEQAAAEGITATVAAGDNGSAGCDPTTANLDAAAGGLAVSGTASTPFNVAVGGTDFNSKLANYQATFWNTTNAATTQASAKSYIPEITWNDSCAAAGSTSGCTSAIITANASTGQDLAAGSGGTSTIYPKPIWQTGTGVPAGNRSIPDLSLFASNGANNSFYIICQQDANVGAQSSTTACDLNSPFNDFQGVGGTSASSPAFAAIMALVVQKTGQRQGLANPTLYSMAKTGTCTSAANPASTCVFYDIPAGGGNNSVACQGGSLNCSNGTSGQFGIMVTSTGGTTPAFNTTAGFDLATGLGSVNVTNLVNGWAPPARGGTTVTLATGTTFPIMVDSAASFSGTVTPSTATGVVALYKDSTTTGTVITTFNVSGGAFNATTALLPGGSYNVFAHYGGDTNNLPSDSGAVAVNVTKQNSQVVVNFVTASGTLTTQGQTVAYGSPYLLRIDVENASGQTCQNLTSGAIVFRCPTGTITLSDKGTPLKDFPSPQSPNATNIANLNNEGFAEDQAIQLPVGSHSITATYSGDTSYNVPASSSNALGVTITQAATTTAVTSSPTTVVAGGTVTLTATVSSNSNGEAPCGSGTAGTVQFKNGSSAISGTVTYTGTSGAQSSTGTASCTAVLTTTLSHVVPPGGPWVGPMTRLRMPLMFWLVAALLLVLARLAAARQQGWTGLRWAHDRRLTYTLAGLALIGTLSAGIAGCSGVPKGNTGGTGGGGNIKHTDNITAVYSGDTNYGGSTSPVTGVGIQ